ncbi:MAG: Uma2 family endonuclease [Gemmatimonadaceae bacterium]
MRESVSPGPMSVAEYLRFEEASTVRHEYVHGEVFVMVGGTYRHSQIALNIAAHVKPAARGSCHVLLNGMKVQAAVDVIYYPDVVVECVARHGEELVLDQPCVVVEVTSRSTRRIDRGEKLDAYRRMPSLRAYLIVDQTRRRVSHHWRDADGTWMSEEITDAGTIDLPCAKTRLTLDEIYEDVELPPLGVAEPEWDSEESYSTE